MTTTWRPPEAYVHGMDAPAVIIPGRIAAWLDRRLGLATLRAEMRGRDAELDSVLVAVSVAAAAWRASATGSGRAAMPAPTADSGWLTTGQAARRAERTDRAIRAAIATKRLPAERIGGRWFVRTEDIEHYAAARAA